MSYQYLHHDLYTWVPFATAKDVNDLKIYPKIHKDLFRSDKDTNNAWNTMQLWKGGCTCQHNATRDLPSTMGLKLQKSRWKAVSVSPTPFRSNDLHADGLCLHRNRFKECKGTKRESRMGERPLCLRPLHLIFFFYGSVGYNFNSSSAKRKREEAKKINN